MSKIQEFLDHLKADNVFESMVVIKQALAEKAREAVSVLNVEVAETFGLKAVVAEGKDEDEDDEKESDKEEKDSEDEDKESDKEDKKSDDSDDEDEKDEESDDEDEDKE